MDRMNLFLIHIILSRNLYLLFTRRLAARTNFKTQRLWYILIFAQNPLGKKNPGNIYSKNLYTQYIYKSKYLKVYLYSILCYVRYLSTLLKLTVLLNLSMLKCVRTYNSTRYILLSQYMLLNTFYFTVLSICSSAHGILPLKVKKQVVLFIVNLQRVSQPRKLYVLQQTVLSLYVHVIGYIQVNVIISIIVTIWSFDWCTSTIVLQPQMYLFKLLYILSCIYCCYI
eukprot:TRINITY_DN825_c0_g1_i1.p3 TRINITY_DN825_c0_g1~~TRINITY_DN825_c0_g1_i1.p3  ORF type:complete len:226 (-),score=-24.12 TRINITY_DN825_c0_g1_i1:291-968(-)